MTLPACTDLKIGLASVGASSSDSHSDSSEEDMLIAPIIVVHEDSSPERSVLQKFNIWKCSLKSSNSFSDR